MSEFKGLSEETKKDIGKMVATIGTTFAVNAMISSLTSKVVKLTATNIHKSSVTGDKILSPTRDETVLSNKETNASNVSSSLADDSVSATNGELNAAETNAAAATSDATASEAGAVASRAKAGASDIETKALKIT